MKRRNFVEAGVVLTAGLLSQGGLLASAARGPVYSAVVLTAEQKILVEDFGRLLLENSLVNTLTEERLMKIVTPWRLLAGEAQVLVYENKNREKVTLQTLRGVAVSKIESLNSISF